MATIVVIGDVGGCADELAGALASIDGQPDTVVIQVGDLIDRGPDSPGVLAIVRERLAGAWRALDEPVTAATVADLLNTRPEDLLWDEQGPLWADAAPRVYPSWLHGAQPMPFGQIHGHSSIVDFDHQRWLCTDRIRHRSTVDWTARHTFTRMPRTARFIGVDPDTAERAHANRRHSSSAKLA